MTFKIIRRIWDIRRFIVDAFAIFGLIGAIITARNIYIQRHAIYSVDIYGEMVEFDILEQIDQELNRRFESVELLIPIKVTNRGIRPVILEQCSGELEVLVFKYFVGTQSVIKTFQYRLTFRKGEAKFKLDKESEETQTRPTITKEFVSNLILGGQEGNPARLLVAPGEKENRKYIKELQQLFRQKFSVQLEKEEKALEERIRRALEQARKEGSAFTGFFRPPYGEAREKLKDEMVLFWEQPPEMIILEDTLINRLMLGPPEKRYVERIQEDKEFMRVLLRVELKDTLGNKKELRVDFFTDCELNQPLYRHLKDYPIKTLGYGKTFKVIVR